MDKCDQYINIKDERQAYNLYIRNKSETYKSYLDWEKHIIEELKKFEDVKELCNFKRSCINKERASSKIPEIFLSSMVLLTPLYIDKIQVELPFWGWVIVLLVSVSSMIYNYRRGVEESYFFTDLIEIIEKQECKMKVEQIEKS